MNTTYKLTFAVLIGMMLATLIILMQRPWQTYGSVEVGSQTQSTTTPQLATRTNLCPAPSGSASTTTGVLDAVHALGPSTGYMLIMDATTTNINLRTGNRATTTLILAWYPVGFGTTTNQFGVEFKNGLLVDYTGTATTTISYRCEG